VGDEEHLEGVGTSEAAEEEDGADGNKSSSSVKGAPQVPTAPIETAQENEPTVVEVDKKPVDVGVTGRASRELFESLMRRGPRSKSQTVDVLIVAAIDKERDALIKEFGAEQWRNPDGSRAEHDLWRAVVDGGHVRYDVAILMGAGAGTIQSIVPIDHAYQDLAPRLVILAGIAAGRPDLQLGDLVVSTGILSITYEKQGVEEFKHRMTSVNASLVEKIVLFAQQHAKDEHLRAGIVIAANAVVRDAAYRDRLFALDSEALAIEMEGGALAEVWQRNHAVAARFAVLKAIVDFADDIKDDRAHAEGCARVATFLRRFLEDGPLPARPGSGRRAVQVTEEGNPIRSSGRRVPRSALDGGARTFVPPPAFADAEEKLSTEGFVVLAGPRHSGRNAAARRLLSAGHSDVYELDETLPGSELARTDLEEGVGYILRADGRGDTGTVIRALAERTIDEQAGVVLCVPPGRSDITTACPDLVVEWRFLADEQLLEAVRLHLVVGGDDAWRSRVAMTLAYPEVRTSLLGVRSTPEMAEAVSLLRRAVDEGWPAGAVVGSLGSAGRVAICERIRRLEDSRGQAWFLAMGVLGPTGLADGTSVAEDLSGRLSAAWPAPAPSAQASPFGGPSRGELLERIDARIVPSTSGVETYGIPGVDGTTTLATVWAEFAQLRGVLLDWLVHAGETLSDDGLPPLMDAVGGLFLVDREAALGVVESWAASFSLRSLVLMEAVLGRAIELGADPGMILRQLRSWAGEDDLSVAVTALMTLGGWVGRAAPEGAVDALAIMLRGEPSGSPRHRVAATALALLLTTPEAFGEVMDLLRRNADDICSTPSLARKQRHLTELWEIVRVLGAVDPVLVLGLEGDAADRAAFCRDLAAMLAGLLADSLASKDACGVLQRWARAARSDAAWGAWLAELLAEIVAMGETYRVRTAVETLLRRIASDPKNRPTVTTIRARLAARPPTLSAIVR